GGVGARRDGPGRARRSGGRRRRPTRPSAADGGRGTVSVEEGGHVDRAPGLRELLGDGGGERRVVEDVEQGGGQAVGPVGRGGAGVGRGGLGRELAGVQGDVGRGDADQRMHAGQAVADVAEVGGGGERRGDHAQRQRVAAAAALRLDPAAGQRVVGAHRQGGRVVVPGDGHADAGHQGRTVGDVLDPAREVFEG